MMQQPQTGQRKPLWGPAMLLLLLACLGVSALAASESEEEKKKKKEAAIRQEANDLLTRAKDGQEGKGIVTVKGKLSLDREKIANDKPLPKVVGYISSQDGLLQVMVGAPTVLGLLAEYDNKEVSLCGKFLDKGDDGKFLLAEEVILPPPQREVRKKRGGLP